MTATADALQTSPPAPAPSAAGFGHRLAPPGDPLEGASFDAVFDAKIKPELVKCEAERKGAIKTFFVALAGGVVLVMLENYLTAPLTHYQFKYADWRIELATIVIAAFVGYLPLSGVAKRAKVGVLTALCTPLGIAYSAGGGDPASFPTFTALNLLPHYSEKAFSDFFSGRRGRVDFNLCEATLHQGSGKSRTMVFNGQLLRLTMPKSFACRTVVLRNTGWFKSFECPRGLSAIGLEDPRFDETFAVFGSDQVAAREILTPALMQQLNALEASYAGSHIRCGFDENQLLVALEGVNRFGIGNMFSNLVQRQRVEGIARSLEQVFKLIDQFDRLETA
jgi:hypothetical protein